MADLVSELEGFFSSIITSSSLSASSSRPSLSSPSAELACVCADAYELCTWLGGLFDRLGVGNSLQKLSSVSGSSIEQSRAGWSGGVQALDFVRGEGQEGREVVGVAPAMRGA